MTDNKKNTATPRPWMNEDGTRKSDGEIKLLGQGWSADTWDRFLDADVGTLKDDSLVFFADMDKAFDLGQYDMADTSQGHGGYEHLKAALLLAMDELSPKERDVVACSFWKGMDDKDIAKKMGMATNAVWVNKSPCHEKIEGYSSVKTVQNKTDAIARGRCPRRCRFTEKTGT